MKNKIIRWISKQVKDAGAKGIVMGLSGGVDSAVVAALCKEAVGRENLLVLFMPCNSNPQDLKDARLVAKKLSLKSKLVDLSIVYDNSLKVLPAAGGLARGNLKPRLRMSTLYYFANKLNYLVCGTGNKSELLVGYFCYDEKTKVLTKDGLKTYRDLVRGDKVFSLNPHTCHVVESEVSEKYVFDYSDRMLHYGGGLNSRIDIMVTPNHRMLIDKKGFGFCRADLLPHRSTPMPLPKSWAGTQNPPSRFIFDNGGVGINARRFSPMEIKDFLYVLGLYLGDGHAQISSLTADVKGDGGTANLRGPKTGRFMDKSIPTAKKVYATHRTWFALPIGTDARSKLLSILKKNNIIYGETPVQVWIYGKPFCEAMMMCGNSAHTKEIPQRILDYSAEYLEKLFEGLMDSDGTSRGYYYTVSKRLAEQIVELGCKLGKNVFLRNRSPRVSTRKDGVKIHCSKSYEVSIYGNGRRWLNGAKFKDVDYSGKVWCPDVPGAHNLLVERNGRFIFCGNTKYGDGGVDILPIADLFKRQVRRLAQELKIPQSIINKPPTAGLWQGQTDEGEMGITYNELDDILDRLCNNKKQIASSSKVDKIKKMYKNSEHKRKGADICRL